MVSGERTVRTPMRLFETMLAALALTLLLSGGSARAQDAPPAARELARLVLTSGTFDSSTALAGETGAQDLRADLEKRVRRRFTEREAGRLQDLFMRLMKEVVTRQEWEALFAARLSSQFSVDEMQALSAFYRTALGAKALHLSDIIVREGAATASRLMKSRVHDFQQRFGVAFEREFATLSGEIRQAERVPSPPATTF